jgi:transposase
MLMGSCIKEIFVAQHAVDFRKGADGLLAECYQMELDPYQGDCVVFVHRSRRSVKVICGNACGLSVLLRRFEGGALGRMFPFLEDPSFVSATHAELALLLEGTTVEVKARATPWRKNPSPVEQPAGAVLPRLSYGKKDDEKSHFKESDSQSPPRGLWQSPGMGAGSDLQP